MNVAEFKSLGGIVIVGDFIKNNPTPVAEGWCQAINDASIFDETEIESFAWRGALDPYVNDFKGKFETNDEGLWRPTIECQLLQGEPKPNRFIYHYCLSYQAINGSVSYIYGIAQLPNRVTCIDDYTELKRLAVEKSGVDVQKVIMNSLSFIGMEQDQPPRAEG